MKYRYISRLLPSDRKKSLALLTGARQTGKTVHARYTYPDLNYINLDAPENRDYLRTVTSFQWHQSIGHAIIDEAQKEPMLFEKVKYAFDSGRIAFTLLTGSSQILLLKKIRESLAGRVRLYELWPLMMGELGYDRTTEPVPMPMIDSILKGDSVDKICTHTVPVLHPEEDGAGRSREKHILDWGGMPALLPLKKDARWKWLRDYVYTYLERDLADLVRLPDLEPFKKFQKLAALRSGQLVNYSELARNASVSVDTAKRYLEYLNISYQAVLLQPFHQNLTSSTIKSPKLYWTDIGILRSLSGLQTGMTGAIFETMVMAEIIKWNRTMQTEAAIYFYRTRTGMELDALIETRQGLTGIEIKNRETASRKDAGILKKIAKATGSKWQGGVVVYRGNTIERIAEPNIWAVPSRRLFIPRNDEFSQAIDFTQKYREPGHDAIIKNKNDG